VFPLLEEQKIYSPQKRLDRHWDLPSIQAKGTKQPESEADYSLPSSFAASPFPIMTSWSSQKHKSQISIINNHLVKRLKLNILQHNLILNKGLTTFCSQILKWKQKKLSRSTALASVRYTVTRAGVDSSQNVLPRPGSDDRAWERKALKKVVYKTTRLLKICFLSQMFHTHIDARSYA
jgi:hypothetical protein